MSKKWKAIWGILTGNMVVGFLSIGQNDLGKTFLLFSSYRAGKGVAVDFKKTIILPENTIAYIPKLTEGRIENPEEYFQRMERVAAAREGKKV